MVFSIIMPNTCNVISHFLLCNLRASGKISVANWGYPHKIKYYYYYFYQSIHLEFCINWNALQMHAFYTVHINVFSPDLHFFTKKINLTPGGQFTNLMAQIKFFISLLFSISHKGINIMWHFYYIFIPDRLFRHSNRIKHTIFPNELIIQIHKRDWYITIQLVKCQIDWISRQNRNQDRQHPKLFTILT